jgi:hypothetical protein
MFRLDRVGETRIVGAQLHFQGLPPNGEPRLNCFDAHFLAGVEIEALMQQTMQFSFDGGLPYEIEPADKYAGKGSGEGG